MAWCLVWGGSCVVHSVRASALVLWLGGFVGGHASWVVGRFLEGVCWGKDLDFRRTDWLREQHPLRTGTVEDLVLWSLGHPKKRSLASPSIQSLVPGPLLFHRKQG